MRKNLKNTLKRVMAMACALMMTLGLSVTAFAAEATGSITVTGKKEDMANKSFIAYRIFELTTDGTSYAYTETNADITKAVNKALKKADPAYEGTTVDAAVGKLNEFKDDDANIRKFADALKAEIKELKNTNPSALESVAKELQISGNTAKAEGLPYGYYIVLETTKNDGNYNGAISLAMIDTVSPDWKQDVKSDYPTVEKKVAETEERLVYGDVADYDINDHVPFKLTGTMPNMDGYKTYKYEFYDKMEKGLTFEKDSVKVYLANGKNNVKTLSPEEYTIVVPAGDDTFAVKINDLKTVKGDLTATHVVVEFTAVLNEEANIGHLGNQNDVYLRFSNNPYDEHLGTEEETTGKTEIDSVKVFTFEMKMDKYKKGEADTKLEGATFELYQDVKGEKKQVSFSTVKGKEGYFVDEDGTITKITTDSNGYFNVKGLDAGTYYLKETKAPDGYNLLNEEIKFVIDAKYNEENLTLTSLSLSINDQKVAGKTPDEKADYVNQNDGTVIIPVENAAGAILPSTGGMGTTVLYVAGILAMAGGLFYFVMNRKSNKNR